MAPAKSRKRRNVKNLTVQTVPTRAPPQTVHQAPPRIALTRPAAAVTPIVTVRGAATLHRVATVKQSLVRITMSYK